MRRFRRYRDEGKTEEAEREFRQAKHYEREIQRLIRNRRRIIEDDVRWERDRMDRAYGHYRDIRDSRERIIREYLAPYRRAVDRARRHLRIVTALHDAAFS